MLLRGCLMAFVLLLAATPAAHAARASVLTRVVSANDPEEPDRTSRVAEIRFDAAPGEVNDVTASAVTAGEARFRDAGARVEAGPGCSAVDAHEVVCSGEGAILGAITLAAGDGDDRVRSQGSVSVLGGAGDDRLDATAGKLAGEEGDDALTGAQLAGGPGADELQLIPSSRGSAAGGPGDDRLAGSAGADDLIGGGGRGVLVAGAGDDLLIDGDGPGDRTTASVDADDLDGGEGDDTVAYTARAAGVVVDLLRPGTAGEPGEGDRLAGVEGVAGTPHADVLTGTDGADRLLGGGGADLLAGRGGPDRLDGGEGRDRLDGNAGDDEVAGGALADHLDGGDGADELSGGPGSDRVSGGAGDDRLHPGEDVDVADGGAGADSLDLTGDFLADTAACGAGRDRARVNRGERPAGCERVRAVRFARLGFSNFIEKRLRVDVSDGRARLAADCDERLAISCRGRVSVRDARGTVARGRFGCPASRRDCFSVAPVRGLRLNRRALRRLRRSRRLDVTLTFVLAPGLGKGGLPVREPARLLLRRRPS